MVLAGRRPRTVLGRLVGRAGPGGRRGLGPPGWLPLDLAGPAVPDRSPGTTRYDHLSYLTKDFRTWHATVLAAVGLAGSERADNSETARKRAVARVVQEVADYLGNTPAVARASYIDPRVIDLYTGGHTIAAALGDLGKDSHFGDLATRGRAEKAVLNLLNSA
jgi:hypothetical protein